MRRLQKVGKPAVLDSHAEEWQLEYEADPSNSTKKHRYRHPEIKQALREETHWKCVYCESKIGHNTPGDVEHKVPSSKEPKFHFEWSNLTVACAECNRRKNDYYEPGLGFLDPYQDDVETCLLHLGPFVYWAPGNPRAEATVRILEIDSGKRSALIDRKRETLEKARGLLELTRAPSSDLLAALRKDEIKRMCTVGSEFSAMIDCYVRQAEQLGQAGLANEPP